MKCKSLLLLMSLAAATYAAQIKDVRFVCDAKGCQTVFAFASDKDLPSFYQKFDASAKKLTVGFSGTSFALGEGDFDVDADSKFIKSVRVVKDTYKGSAFLKFEMTVGASISTDKNEIALDKSNFLIKSKNKGGKSWTLSKLFADRKKQADKLALEEKKHGALPLVEDIVHLGDVVQRVVGGFLPYSEQTDDEVTATRLRKHRNFFL